MHLVLVNLGGGTYSHQGGATYYATDLVPYDSNGNRIFRAPCYAPVDIKLLWKETANCVALWQSVNPVHFADGTEDYLGIIVYHDNDIVNGTYANVGDIVSQGQIFNHTGTGGNVSGDHVHLETGKGQVNLQSDYLYHFRDDTGCKRIKPDLSLFINDTRIIPDSYNYYQGYNFIEFQGGITPSPTPEYRFTKTKFKWVLYANKLRNRNLN